MLALVSLTSFLLLCCCVLETRQLFHQPYKVSQLLLVLISIVQRCIGFFVLADLFQTMLAYSPAANDNVSAWSTSSVASYFVKSYFWFKFFSPVFRSVFLSLLFTAPSWNFQIILFLLCKYRCLRFNQSGSFISTHSCFYISERIVHRWYSCLPSF